MARYPGNRAIESDKGHEMPFTFPIMVLASQLVVSVADDLPKFDIARGCRIDSATIYNPSIGLDATIKRCVDDEQQAKSQLEANWSGYAEKDRAMCKTETVGDSRDDTATPPSYVELLTCLQDQQMVKKLPKD
jgi:hypothetical protein